MVNELWNPAQIEQAIRVTSDRIAKGVAVCNKTYMEFLEADHAYDVAVARAFLNAEGSIDARKHQTTLTVIEGRQNRDTADAAYRYADRQAKALENELRAYQSINASIRSQYVVAGVGEH